MCWEMGMGDGGCLWGSQYYTYGVGFGGVEVGADNAFLLDF